MTATSHLPQKLTPALKAGLRVVQEFHRVRATQPITEQRQLERLGEAIKDLVQEIGGRESRG